LDTSHSDSEILSIKVTDTETDRHNDTLTDNKGRSKLAAREQRPKPSRPYIKVYDQ